MADSGGPKGDGETSKIPVRSSTKAARRDNGDTIRLNSSEFMRQVQVYEQKLAPWYVIINTILKPIFAAVIILLTFLAAASVVLFAKDAELIKWAQYVLSSIVGMAIGIWAGRSPDNSQVR
ncbi:MAG: hypothetical protein FJX20_10960 [Alphaproteobacteria bacterium]|nr:hypothetical protein [Alphaproteobacteria bacterium]